MGYPSGAARGRIMGYLTAQNPALNEPLQRTWPRYLALRRNARTRSGGLCQNAPIHPAGRVAVCTGARACGDCQPAISTWSLPKDEKSARASARSAAAVAEMVAVLDEPRSELAELLGDLLDLAASRTPKRAVECRIPAEREQCEHYKKRPMGPRSDRSDS